MEEIKLKKKREIYEQVSGQVYQELKLQAWLAEFKRKSTKKKAKKRKSKTIIFEGF